MVSRRKRDSLAADSVSPIGKPRPGYDEGLEPIYLTEEPLVSFVGVCPGAVEGRRAALALFASRKGDG